MKKLILNFTAIAFAINTWAQAPQTMSYQAVIRNASNSLVISSSIGMKISILQGSSTGTPVYVETQTSTTNANGLVSLEIGNGTVVSGTFSSINWASGPYFLETETDPSGGTNYTVTGTSQLNSVPYALYASTSGASGTDWNLKGNAGTRDSVNFVGTTDKKPFNIRVNNMPSGRIDSASGNTFFGYEGGNFPVNKGINNTVIGMQSLQSNTTGIENTAGGYHSLVKNTTGGNNVGYGFCSLVNNTSGSSNTALGNWTLFLNTASQNTAVGDSALYANTTGNGNTAIGYQALTANTVGINNTVIGMQSLQSNTTGIENTAGGYHSLVKNTTGGNNVGYGFCSLVNNSIGSSNTALGNWTLFLNTASQNTAVGDSALYASTTGTGNTAVGYQALTANTTGTNNTAIGYMANDGVNATGASNSTAIGYQATITGSNQIVLGNASISQLTCAVPLTVTSDGRFKKNITEDIHGLDFIMKLRPVSYNLDVTGLNKFNGKNSDDNDLKSIKQAEMVKHNGFIAQEVEKAAKEVNYIFSGLKTPENSKDIYGLGYADFVVPLVKAVQELNVEKEQLKSENTLLKALLDKQTSKLNSLENMQTSDEKDLVTLKNLINTLTEKAEASTK